MAGNEKTTTVLSGSRVQFLIGASKIAYASNVSFNENIQYEPINVLDMLEVMEHAEVGYTVDLQCQNFRVSGKSVKGLQIMSKFEEILTQGELTAEVMDTANKFSVLHMMGVKLQARQTTVDARGVMTETWTFVGRKSTDETP